ncbi:MAG: Gfo/Idh/MocA family oxidoreductase [Pseudomonadota bacterium]
MRCALIGLGMVAGTHVAALKASETVSLAGVMGRDPARAKAFAAEHDVKRVFTEVGALIDAAPDFVILATPPDARSDFARRFADAAIPILMEKPIERTADAAREIVEICEAAQVPLGVTFQLRTRAASQALKIAIEDGTLGQISHVDIRVPWWRAQSYYDAPGRGTYARDGGGVMITQAIHTLDLALWMLGPVARVAAMTGSSPLHQLEAEDWAGGVLAFQSGVLGNVMATTASFPGVPDSLEVHGTKGRAFMEGSVLRVALQDGTETVVGASGGSGGGADPMAFTHDWHQAVIEDFVQAICTGRAPLASGRDALAVHELIGAMEMSSKSQSFVELG